MGSALATLLAIGAWSAGADPATRGGNGPSLIVIEPAKGTDGLNPSECRIVRYRLRDGKPDGKAEVLHTASQSYFVASSFGRVLSGHVLVAGRYLVTARGNVFDTVTKAAVRSVKEGTRCLRVENGKVVYQTREAGRQPETVVLDLAADTVERRQFKSSDDLSSGHVRSPDGRQSVYQWSAGEFFRTRGPASSVSLGKDFLPSLSYGDGRVTKGLIWLDDDRFLTELKDHRLVVVGPDGTRDEVLQLPPLKTRRADPAYFRDSDGQVVYARDKQTTYRIDVAGRKYEAYEWYPVGSGFEVQWRPETKPGAGARRAVRYRGSEVGRWDFDPLAVVATDGHVAVPRLTECQVWSVATKQWVPVKFGDGGNVIAGVVGWAK